MKENNIVKKCPVCEGDVYISSLTCHDCSIEIKGKFKSNSYNFESLTDDEMIFVNIFMKCEGKYVDVQKETGLTYNSVKEKINNINKKLGNVNKHSKGEVMEKVRIYDTDSMVVKTIKEKFNESNGVAHLRPLKGNNDIKAFIEENGCTVDINTFNEIISFKGFDLIVDKAKELGGIMYKGDSAAHGGSKIGDSDLSLNTIDGLIGYTLHNRNIGDSTMRRSTYYAFILDWAGIAYNCKSTGNGKGGYIELRGSYR